MRIELVRRFTMSLAKGEFSNFLIHCVDNVELMSMSY